MNRKELLKRHLKGTIKPKGKENQTLDEYVEEWMNEYPEDRCLTNSSYGEFKHCPGCDQEAQTSCCACGCGNCYYCAYQFVCNPLPINYKPEVIYTY